MALSRFSFGLGPYPLKRDIVGNKSGKVKAVSHAEDDFVNEHQ
jgi:hypothetical protein